jgi:hypothetical protein
LNLASAAPSSEVGRVVIPGTGSASFATTTPLVQPKFLVTPGTARLVIVTSTPKRNAPNWGTINDTQFPNWIQIAA